MDTFGWAILAAIGWGLTPILEKWGLQDTADPALAF